MPRPSRLLSALVLMVGLLLPAAASAATDPSPTPTAAAASDAAASATQSPSPGARPAGAQYRPDQGNDWSGSLIILGFFVLAMGGLVYVVRKGLASSADED